MMVKALVKVTLSLFVTLSSLAHAASEPHTVIPTVKLHPRMRVEEPNASQKTDISLKKVLPFLKASLIFDNKNQYETAPYIIAQNDNQMEGGTSSTLYAKGILDANEDRYSIFKPGRTYRHPITQEVLGFEALVIGSAELKASGSPAQLEVVHADEAVEIGARLLPSFTAALPSNLPVNSAQKLNQEGYILSVRDGFEQIGPSQIVVISLGKRDGVEAGNLLEIHRAGIRVPDPMHKGWRAKKIQLPDRQLGKLWVYQSYEKLSIALVVQANTVIHPLDKVKSGALGREE